MGYRLHVAKTYKVEYALGDAFNYKVEEFHEFLSACGADYTGDLYDSDFEVCKEDWQMVIEKLKNLDSIKDVEKTDILRCIEELECTEDEVLEMLEYYLENADTSDGYLHLSFF